jgi:hypothetical protein
VTENWFEVEVRVKAAGQEDAVIHREYVSQDAASTDKAAGQIWSGVSSDVKARMRTVNTGG